MSVGRAGIANRRKDALKNKDMKGWYWESGSWSQKACLSCCLLEMLLHLGQRSAAEGVLPGPRLKPRKRGYLCPVCLSLESSRPCCYPSIATDGNCQPLPVLEPEEETCSFLFVPFGLVSASYLFAVPISGLPTILHHGKSSFLSLQLNPACSYSNTCSQLHCSLFPPKVLASAWVPAPNELVPGPGPQPLFKLSATRNSWATQPT